MLSTGCVSGAVQLDLSLLVSLFAAVIPLTIQLEREEIKATVVNSFGISTFDLCVILPKLKLQCLLLIMVLLRSPVVTLSKAATGIIRPLSNLLVLPCSSTALLMTALQCFGQAAACFPTSLPTVGQSGLVRLLAMFEEEVTWMTQKSDQLATTSFSSVRKSNIKEYSSLVLRTVETVLLCCSPMLSKSLRESFESLVAEALVCVCKGVLSPSLLKTHPPWSGDRRVKRSVVELIRCDLDLQAALLRLALTEIQAPHPDGHISGNIALLRRTAEICSQLSYHTWGTHTSFDAISFEACRVLLVINSILHPSILSLPNNFMKSNASKNLIFEQRELFNGSQRVRAETKSEGMTVTAFISDSDANMFGKRKRAEYEDIPSLSVDRNTTDTIDATTAVSSSSSSSSSSMISTLALSGAPKEFFETDWSAKKISTIESKQTFFEDGRKNRGDMEQEQDEEDVFELPMMDVDAAPDV